MISIGLLGAGRIGQIHGRNIAHSARAKLAAIADPMPNGAKSLSEATGAPIKTPEEILADKSIDAILIGTPTDTHADFIDKAAKAGKKTTRTAKPAPKAKKAAAKKKRR